MSSVNTRVVLIAVGIALLAVIVLPLLFMGALMDGMMTAMMSGGG